MNRSPDDKILVMYSGEFVENDLPWRVETSSETFYTKTVNIQVPSKTLHRADKSPAYVLECRGLVQYNMKDQSVTIF